MSEEGAEELWGMKGKNLRPITAAIITNGEVGEAGTLWDSKWVCSFSAEEPEEVHISFIHIRIQKVVSSRIQRD